MENNYKKELSKEELVQIVKEGIDNINESKFSFLNAVRDDILEYVYLTDDNYLAYYFVKRNSPDLDINKLTERIKITDGILYRWDKERKDFEKADVKKIEECFLCRIPFFRKRLIKKLKNRVAVNLSLANIGFDNKNLVERIIYEK